MHRTRARLRGALFATPLLMAFACGGTNALETSDLDAQAADSAEESESLGEIQQSIEGVTNRSDFKQLVELNPGSWGDWQATRFCPEGHFVVGYHMRVETSRGDGDDTGLNAVELMCMDAVGRIAYVSAHDGSWGGWNPGASCGAGSFVKGGEVRFESSRGSGDDTAGNDVRFTCSNGASIQAPGGTTWGTWQGAKSCPTGSAACGVSVRFESSQGSNDDTALNAVKLACCTAPAARLKVSVTDTTMDGIVARTFSPDAGAFKAPLILIEGFDQDNSTSVDKIIHDELPANMIKTLTDLGYTVSIVDLSKNWESIKTNARRLGAFADHIWSKSQKTTPIKLVGASMGGLIATTTTALRLNPAALSEANPGWSFNVDHVTTLDSPHSGAYIPQAIFHVVSRFQGWETQDLFNAMTSPAVKEMLMIPFDSSYETAHAAWQQYYDKALTVVRKSDVRFVAVSNGSWTGVTQAPDWTSRFLNIRWRTTGNDYNAEADLYTQPAPGTNVARIRFDLAGPIDETKNYNAYAGDWPIVENSPGGFGTQWAAVGKTLRGNPTVKFPQSSFVPTWSAIAIPMAKWKALPVSQRENMSALEAARGRLVGSDLVPFDRIIAGTTNTKHTKLDGPLASGFIDELMWAATTPSYRPVWSQWYDNDDPTGNGDNESRSAAVSCKVPLTAECRRVRDGVDWKSTGENVTCTPQGLVCLNNVQSDSACDDYEVRFACPRDAELTPWLNRDDPSGNGDGEHFGIFLQEGQVCAAPLSAECETPSGTSSTATGEVVSCGSNVGSVCENANQSDGSCQDYRVRFACPSGGVWTNWLDRDDPSGNGDGEHLGVFIAADQACAQPLGVECRRVSDKLNWPQTGEKVLCSPTQGAICLNGEQPDGSCADYEVRFFCGGDWPTP